MRAVRSNSDGSCVRRETKKEKTVEAKEVQDTIKRATGGSGLDAFSKNQWKKGATRACKTCVASKD